MNLIKYICTYKDYSFEERAINEIDKLIFALLSYIKYDGLVSKNSKNKRTIEDVGNDFFIKNSRKSIKNNILAIRDAIKILAEIKNTKRYKNLYLYNDIYIGDNNSQFSALCIEINPKLVYISYEGTDQLISGWEEDCKLTYKFPVKAQKEAIRYLNRNMLFKDCEIIIGGHSKGGNLALVAAMYSSILVKRKIKEVYSYDGPGLRRKQLDSIKYKKIKDKFIHIIPNNSIVGLLLRHDNNYKVIKSNRFGIMAHAALTWQIEEENFKEAKLSTFSKILENGMTIWLNKYNNKKRRKFVKCLFEIFYSNNINDLTEIKNNYSLIIDIIKNKDRIDPIIKEMLTDLIRVLKKCNKEYIKIKIGRI